MERSHLRWTYVFACISLVLAALFFSRSVFRSAGSMTSAATPAAYSGSEPGPDSIPEMVSPAVPGDRAPPGAEKEGPPTPAPAPAVLPPSESVHAKLQRQLAGVKLIASERGWDKAYDGISNDVLKLEVDKIEGLIYESTKDELHYRFSIGMGVETLSTDPNYKYDGKGYDPTAVYWVRFTPGGPTEKLTLPKEEFPEIYELKAQSAYLRDMLAQNGVGYGW